MPVRVLCKRNMTSVATGTDGACYMAVLLKLCGRRGNIARRLPQRLPVMQTLFGTVRELLHAALDDCSEAGVFQQCHC